MIKALLKSVPDIKLDRDHTMIVSPDEGGMGRCIYYSSVLGLELGMFYKRRNYSVIVNGRNPIEAHEFLGNDITGKDLILVDDMISSGDSVLDLAVKLKELKAELFNLRFQHAINQLENPMRIQTVKREIAKVNTVLSEIAK
jgi:ribose-phosphate pyrophosphokinase